MSTGVLLKDAQSEMVKKLKAGTECPCCGQFAKMYKLTISAGMARALIWICQQSGPERAWVAVEEKGPRWLLRSRSHAKLRHWNLLERRENLSTKKRHSGIYRPSIEGQLFVEGKLRVFKNRWLYNNKCRGADGEQISIEDCLGEPFDFSKLMEAA